MKRYLLTAFWLSIFALFAKAATFDVPKKPKPTIPKPTLTEVFKDVGRRIGAIVTTKAKKVSPVEVVELSRNYNVRNYSIVTAAHLEQDFQGVLMGKGEIFLEEARRNEICPIFLAAVAMHESAKGTSKLARQNNNVFGIFKGGKYHRFDSVDECIKFSAKLLGGKLYAGGRNDTVAEIQKIYCPVGAANDPNGLNKHWLDGVLKYMRQIFGEEIYVKG